MKLVKILASGDIPVTELRASVIVGAEGAVPTPC